LGGWGADQRQDVLVRMAAGTRRAEELSVAEFARLADALADARPGR